MNLSGYSWNEVDKKVKASDAVMILVGSTEEHGYHLPIATDTMITEAIAERLCADKHICYYPCTVYGQVWSAKGFPGTISISPEVLKRYLKEIIQCILSQEAKKIILYSFHNGNADVLKECLRELRDEYGYQNIYMLETKNIHKKAGHILTTPLWNGHLWHAGELETALMLYLADASVNMDRACREFPEVPLGFGERAVPWIEFSKSGVFGDSTAATKKKGKEIFEIIIKDLEERVEEIFSIGL